MNEDDKSFRLGHRERLRQKFLENKLAEYELLELLLSFVIPRRDVRPLAHILMKNFGSIHQIFAAPMKSLLRIAGIGKNTAIFIKAVYQVMIADYKFCLNGNPIFHNEKILVNYCKLLLSSKTVEELHILYLDSRWRLLSDEIHSSGTVNSASVYPREILKRALDLNAENVVMFHNHLTPNTSFSSEDIETTAKVKKTLEVAGIKLHDHYIISGGLIYSARELFLLN